MSYEQAETFLLLKYGSMHDAYRAWQLMTLDEQYKLDKIQYEVIMAFEYEMHINGPGPFEPR